MSICSLFAVSGAPGNLGEKGGFLDTCYNIESSIFYKCWANISYLLFNVCKTSTLLDALRLCLLKGFYSYCNFLIKGLQHQPYMINILHIEYDIKFNVYILLRGLRRSRPVHPEITKFHHCFVNNL